MCLSIAQSFVVRFLSFFVVRYLSRVLYLFVAIFFSGCGGEDQSYKGEMESKIHEYPKTVGEIIGANVGIFSAVGVVQGVEYRSGDISGVTNEYGQFYYHSGNRIEFFVGKTELGSAKAKNSMTPMDLVEGIELPVTRDEAEGYVDTHLYTSSIYVSEKTKRIDVLANINSFLLSLDLDKDPSNGIKIHAGTLVHLESKGFDLSLLAREFEENTYYNLVLFELYNSIYLKNAVAVKSLKALDLFYQSQNLSNPLFVLSEAKVADGGQSEPQVQYKRLFNDQGYITSYARWDDNELDYYSRYEYSDYGDFTLIHNTAGNGSDSFKIYEYNEHGKRTLREEYANTGFRYEAVYDQRGNYVQLNQDSDRNGTVDQVNSFEYDNRGNLVLEQRDYENDGSVDDRLFYQYDEEDREISLKRDDGVNLFYRYEKQWGDDGRLIYYANYPGSSDVPDRIVERKYVADGEIYSIKNDNDLDGQFEGVRIEKTDLEGRIVSNSYDEDGDGAFESIHSYEYDHAGNLVIQQFYYVDTEPFDGNVIHYFTYDEMNQRVRTESDYGSNGDINYIEELVYDDDGHLVQKKKIEVDDDLIELHTFQFNDQSKLIYSEKNRSDTELPIEFTRRDYNKDGELVLFEQDTDGDGIADQVFKFDYSETEYYVEKRDRNGNGIFEIVYHFDVHGNVIRFESLDDTTGLPKRITISSYKEVGYMSYFLSRSLR